ncbi:hypothetical protein [Parafilimonas sp.]|uniref:hypothetical protein n=1 Tax=Parafilimonas sp. TaxID=1969739 RepID=UPI0039E66435
MKKDITIRNKSIQVLFHQYSIGIVSNDQLLKLVKDLPEDATAELISAIKKEFNAQYNKPFNVSDNSITVEIWAHVFAEQFACAIKQLTTIRLVNDIAQKISAHCKIINIGERGHDNNRFVWDMLSNFKPAIRKLLL